MSNSHWLEVEMGSKFQLYQCKDATWSTSEKLKHFVWKAMTNILPSYENLRRRGVNAPVLCPSCNWYQEDSIHVFRDCSEAKEMCKCFFGDDWRWKDDSIDFTAWLEKRKVQLPREVLYGVLIVCWFRWYSRNQFVHNDVKWSAGKIVSAAADWHSNWKSINNQGMKVNNVPTVSDHWKCPPRNFYKINTDATWRLNENGGIGAIIRGEERSAVFVAAAPVGLRGSVEAAELLAILLGLETAWNCGCLQVILETDNLSIAKA